MPCWHARCPPSRASPVVSYYWIYAGKQIDEPWAILPACEHHHKLVESQPAVKAAFEAASLVLVRDADLLKYPRRDWGQVRKALGLVGGSRKPSTRRA